MISHKYKCIYIHVQGTGGTSVENWICGNDWWHIEPKTKHLLASQAKKMYKKYWDEYFKFSIVRNPFDRMVSLNRFPNTIGVKLKNNILDFNKYKKIYGHPIILEHDHRFYNYFDILKKSHFKETIYGNIIDEKLDYIGRFEEFEKVIEYLRDILKISNVFNFHSSKSKKRCHYKNYYNAKNKEELTDMCRFDLEKYNYKFEEK